MPGDGRTFDKTQYVDGEFVGLSQLVQLKVEVQELFARFDATGRESFEREMLPNGYPGA